MAEPLPVVYDVLVIGGTPGGIAAALIAARLGRRVALAEYHPQLGGMAASGLGKSDIEHREMIGGLFTEFTERVHRDYRERFGPVSNEVALCRDGYYFEPSAARRVFEAMLAEQPGIDVLPAHSLCAVDAPGGTVRQAILRNRRDGGCLTLAGRVFIDATYEGDLYAMAGAAFHLGRESRDEFDEPHAGVVYFDYEAGEFLPGSTGEADHRLPAYTYRLCLTTDPANRRVLDAPPDDYDRHIYAGYFDDLAAGRLGPPRKLMDGWGYYPAHFGTLVRALSVAEIPNQKVDANINPRPLAFPFPEENAGYVEADGPGREAVCRRHRNLTLGLLYFLQNDAEVPAEHRRIARQYHLPLDEFTDSEHFPFQLYIREARRLRGLYTLSERDVTGLGGSEHSGRHDDAVAVGEFPIDSFPTRKREPGHDRVLEGYLGMLNHITRPYQIPYRIMIPERVDGLIVPVAASATHVAYSSIRMEPTWMALGQAAGAAAHLAIADGIEPRAVSAASLQRILAAQGQVLEPRVDGVSEATPRGL